MTSRPGPTPRGHATTTVRAGGTAERLVAGAGRYVADLLPDGCVHAAFVRSAVAHGRIRDIDARAAAALPGVVACWVAADFGDLGALAMNPVFEGIRDPLRPTIVADTVLAVGEIVAVVVARDATCARRAADAVAVDIDARPAVVDPIAALDAPALLADRPDNLVYDRRYSGGDVDAAFAASAHRVSLDLAMPRVAPVPMEPRAALAMPDGAGLHAVLATQSPHRARADLARLLGLPPERVRVTAPDVGGAFGGKASTWPEDVLVAAAALRLARPVRWVATRLEDFVAASHGRGARLRASLAFDADGSLRALRADLVFPVGARGTFSAAVPGWNAARILPGPYRVDAIDVRTRGVLVNTAAVGIYRGAGRPEAALVLERLMDAAAARIGMDPVELRRRNLRRAVELPAALPSGAVLDHADFDALIARARRLAGYDDWRAEQGARRARGELVGIGTALYVEPCGQGWESATVRRDSDGGFTVASGSSSQGQDHATLFARIAAEALGVAAAEIRVIEGDTGTAPAGIGALASRSTAIGGSAVAQAARELRSRLDGAPAGTALEATAVYTARREAWSSGCAFALVSVDPDTGAAVVERFAWVDDAGRVIDEAGAHAQLVGGLAQGLGSVLTEALHIDADGQVLSGSLQDYALPRAGDLPAWLRLASAPTTTDANLLGARGVGESGCIVAPSAVLNAVHDALAPRGVTDLRLPLAAPMLWAALAAAPCEEPAR